MQIPLPRGSRSRSQRLPAALHSPPPFVHGLPIPLQLPLVVGHAVPPGGSHAGVPASGPPVLPLLVPPLGAPLLVPPLLVAAPEEPPLLVVLAAPLELP